VLDHEARKLTELKTNGLAKCIVSGSPKHEAYQARLVDWMKKKPLQYQEEKSVVFIGQPSDIIGIQDNFKIFVSTINQVRSSVKIYFKAHPADVGYLAQYRKILEEQSHPYEIIENNIDIEAILYQADVVVTCFSTSGLDHNYLQLYANQPLGELIYLTIGEDLLGFIEKVVGVAEIPGAKSGMGVTCRSDKELLEVLQKYLQGQSSNYQEVVTKCLGSGGSPTQTIFGYIQSLIH